VKNVIHDNERVAKAFMDEKVLAEVMFQLFEPPKLQKEVALTLGNILLSVARLKLFSIINDGVSLSYIISCIGKLIYSSNTEVYLIGISILNEMFTD
jgi:hypothetical protein